MADRIERGMGGEFLSPKSNRGVLQYIKTPNLGSTEQSQTKNIREHASTL